MADAPTRRQNNSCVFPNHPQHQPVMVGRRRQPASIVLAASYRTMPAGTYWQIETTSESCLSSGRCAGLKHCAVRSFPAAAAVPYAGSLPMARFAQQLESPAPRDPRATEGRPLQARAGRIGNVSLPRAHEPPLRRLCSPLECACRPCPRRLVRDQGGRAFLGRVFLHEGHICSFFSSRGGYIIAETGSSTIRQVRIPTGFVAWPGAANSLRNHYGAILSGVC